MTATCIREMIERAARLLPMPGPITAFGFLNTLQGLEELPFLEGMRKGAILYGCEPFLSEDRYRAMLPRGRIRPDDLISVLRDDMGLDADRPIGGLASRLSIRLAMVQSLLQVGPPEELRWFVAETDALTRFPESVPPPSRERFVEETRHWAMRDLSDAHDSLSIKARDLLAEIPQRFGDSSIEHWNDPVQQWEMLTLQVLWRVCRDGVSRVKRFAPSDTHPFPLRHRDVICAAGGGDSDVLVHPLLIRFCAAFTDQGFAHWNLPDRDQGFFRAFCTLYAHRRFTPEPWLKGLSSELRRMDAARLSPLDSIQESLQMLGISQETWDEYITASLLALRGWAGMLWQMEVRSDRVPLPVPKETLIEYLAVQLILERLALAYVAETSLNYHGPLGGMKAALHVPKSNDWETSLEQEAFVVFQLAQRLEWTPPRLFRLSDGEWSELVDEITSFSGQERRWVYHRAFERRYVNAALSAISVHAQQTPMRVADPQFQAVFCLDAREESFRRYLEEIEPNCETFGTAGFFGVAMYYRGLAEAHFSAQCPIVIKPQHWVIEEVEEELLPASNRQAHARHLLGTAAHRIHRGSRSVLGGAFLTAGLGVLATVPLMARVLFPQLTASIRHHASRFVQPRLPTKLRLERQEPTPGPNPGQIGFTVEEMANIGERMLRDIGLTTGFARLVLFFGHGSFCLNNPHRSVYDCGACTGSPGGPNARALAAMLNDERVRTILAQRGLPIPATTQFVGGLHNTATETVEILDLENLQPSHRPDLQTAIDVLEQACERNAHERCRRFDSAPLGLSFDEAQQHVRKRSEDLAQTRPEFGNASNAVCFVGRRARSRGLFMDRRSFLASYDPTQDDEDATILARILSAVIPVCEGINMQYNLSSIDSNGWSCGTKLPHNIVSLLGVMLGTSSDLKPGLPWQSVEIHEPMRLLFVVEASPAAMQRIMAHNPVIARILRNQWSRLAVLDPASHRIQLFDGSQFYDFVPETKELAHVGTSTEWYRGWRDHLGFAVVDRGCLPQGVVDQRMRA